MSQPVISIRNVSKRYVLGSARHDTLRDHITDGFKRIFQSRAARATEAEADSFWALKDVSLDINQGEVVGVIGRNGAGKSTLLKILSQITEPTKGEVHMRGRVASLLEVGTGFHPELSGRENIFLNGAILGMSRAEITKKFDEIVAFADIDRFLDTPVKRYSSGMYVRLAFSVAAHLEPEILIVDEVLAVGDAQFQKKCLGRMSVVAKQGRTVLFVSHNINAIQALTQRCVLLTQGCVTAIGESNSVIEKYICAADAEKTETDFRSAPRMNPKFGTNVRICEIEPLHASPAGFWLEGDLTFRIRVESNRALRNFRFGATISDVTHLPIISLMTSTDLNMEAGSHCFNLVIRNCGLTTGVYSTTLSIGVGDFFNLREHYDVINPGPTFNVATVTSSGSALVNWMRVYGSMLHPQSQIEVTPSL